MIAMPLSMQDEADQLVEEFDLFDSWEDRYSYLADIGRKLPDLTPDERTEENRIQGCQSPVWIAFRPASSSDRSVDFQADSSSPMVKGLMAILQRIYGGQPAADILSFDLDAFLQRIGLAEHLSPTRQNGLKSAVQRIDAFAQAIHSGQQELSR
jgi:cysteine desulfuration protein SufE